MCLPPASWRWPWSMSRTRRRRRRSCSGPSGSPPLCKAPGSAYGIRNRMRNGIRITSASSGSKSGSASTSAQHDSQCIATAGAAMRKKSMLPCTRIAGASTSGKAHPAAACMVKETGQTSQKSQARDETAAALGSSGGGGGSGSGSRPHVPSQRGRRAGSGRGGAG